MIENAESIFAALSDGDADTVWECVYRTAYELSEHPDHAEVLDQERFDSIVMLTRGEEEQYLPDYEDDDDRALAHMVFWRIMREHGWSTWRPLDDRYEELLLSLLDPGPGMTSLPESVERRFYRIANSYPELVDELLGRPLIM
ncbi:MAG: hypothetical protein KDD55_05835 [Bdellovibrionales bacterium]|nr:hypothetical protein [Bdellovibrionales bacterium]